GEGRALARRPAGLDQGHAIAAHAPAGILQQSAAGAAITLDQTRQDGRMGLSQRGVGGSGEENSSEVARVTLQTLSIDVSPRRIATVLLNRPDRGNAFDQTMLDELVEELAALP